jgi:osmotically-inducible protein OsmY
LLTGQAASQGGAELIRQFAVAVASPSSNFDDQLAVRSTGDTQSPVPPGGAAENGANPPPVAGPDSGAAVSPGSNVCVNVSDNSEVLLTGTVGSPADLATVERAAQPLLGSERLIDQLTIADLSAGRGAMQPGAVGNSNAVAPYANAAVPPPISGANRQAQPPAPGALASAGPNAQPTAAGAPNPAITNPQTSLPVAQNQVEQALHSLPRLSNVNVDVSGDAIRLSGSVPTMADEHAAKDLAQQYAPGKPVLENMTITGAVQPPQ